MGRKQHWFKAFSFEYFADDKIRDLGPIAQNYFNNGIHYLRTQTDIPGLFIVKRKILSVPEIALSLSRFHKRDSNTSKYRLTAVQELLDIGLFCVGEIDPKSSLSSIRVVSESSLSSLSVVSEGVSTVVPNGYVVYSPRVFEEAQEYEVKRKAGLARYYGSGHQRGHQGGALEEKRVYKHQLSSRTHLRTDPNSVPDAPSWEDLLKQEKEKTNTPPITNPAESADTPKVE